MWDNFHIFWNKILNNFYHIQKIGFEIINYLYTYYMYM